MQDLAIFLHDLRVLRTFRYFYQTTQIHGATYVVLTNTSSTVKINDYSKTNSSKIPSSLSRGRKFPIDSILDIEKYCYQSLGLIGILCGYYIRFELL